MTTRSESTPPRTRRSSRRKKLKRYEAVIFLSTTGTVLEEPQKRAFMRFVRRGGGYVGIHSAADTEYDWPFYGRLVGAYFANHPIQQSATFVNEGPRHPATAHLDERFRVFDEFYSFQAQPAARTCACCSRSTSRPSPRTRTRRTCGGKPASGSWATTR